MSEPMRKATLLAAILAGREQFNALLAELSAAQLTQAGAIGAWSVKDTLAHIVVHEQRMLQWLAEKLRGATPAAFQPYDMPDLALAELNLQIYQENRDRAWAEVFQDWQLTAEQTQAFVAAADEADLMSTRQFQLRGGEALWQAVAANTFEHYAEHGQDIRAWLEK